MELRLSNKVVVVVGGSRGIGLEWVRQLLALGNRVVATARDPSAATGLRALQGQHGDRLAVTALDTTSLPGISKWAEGLKEGEPKLSHIDVVINNAGAAFETFEHGLADLTTQTLADTLAVNAYGPILVTQALLKQSLLGGYAPSVIAYTTSVMASMGGFAFPAARMYAYRASKAALNSLVATSVHELTPKNITSVLLHPGYVATDMTAGHSGTISTEESVSGQLRVLQAQNLPLNGKFYSYNGDEIPF